jgi:NADPH:quinone reductase-like Zn-dependent oxidoreductase
VGSDRAQIAADALWYVAPGRAELRPEKVNPPPAGQVLVRALPSAISRGTEALVFNGRVPEGEFSRMAVPHMGGAFPFPVKYGYAVVGRIEHGPPALADRTVFALHPHQSRFTAPAEAVVPVPSGVPAERAVLAANMETALNAVWDARAAPADRIAVIGAGVVGALVGWLCGRLPGAEVTLVDIEPARAELARSLGVGFAAPDAAPGECDLVFHASASAAGLATAIACAGEEAAVVELSWYGSGTIPAALGGSFHSRRQRLLSSQVGKVAPSHRARWTHRQRLAAALALLADARLDALLEAPIAFGELPTRLPHILAPGSGVLCQRIDY